MESENIAKLLSLVANPLRIEIINYIDNKPRSFTEIMNELSIESTSKLSFHLEKLSPLLQKNHEGNYELTLDGEKIYHLLTRVESEELQMKDNFDSSIRNYSFRKDFLLFVALSYCIGFSFLLIVSIFSIVSLQNNQIIANVLLIITIFLPLMYFIYYFYLIRYQNFDIRKILINILGLILIYCISIFTAFNSLELLYSNYISIINLIMEAIINFVFNESFIPEIILLQPDFSISILLIFWFVTYGIIYLIIFLLSSHISNDVEFSSIFIPTKFFSPINNKILWLFITIIFIVSTFLSSNLFYDVSSSYFATPSIILPSYGYIFPRMTHLFPILPSLLIFMYLLIFSDSSTSLRFNQEGILIFLISIGPSLLLLVTMIDTLTLFGSLEMNDPNFLPKLIVFLISKLILCITQILSLLAYTITLLNCLRPNKSKMS